MPKPTAARYAAQPGWSILEAFGGVRACAGYWKDWAHSVGQRVLCGSAGAHNLRARVSQLALLKPMKNLDDDCNKL